MFGLTPLGVLHTAVSLVAVVAGATALVRDRTILPGTPLGRVYVWTTVITCLTGFGIFQHGGFGKPHALGVLTLIVLAVALAGGPLFSGPEDPALQKLIGGVFLVYLVGAGLQVRRLRAG